MSGIFISYRCEDSEKEVERMYKFLRKHLPDMEVFRDLGGIKAAEDWMDTIRDKIESSNVVLVVIGKNWLKVRDREARRIDDPEDILRREVIWAFEQNRMVMPILMSGVPMPSKRDLPTELKRLHRQQARRIRDKHFDEDEEKLSLRLIHMIDKEERRIKREQEDADAFLDEFMDEELEVLPGVYLQDFSIAGKWKCEIASSDDSDPQLGYSGHAKLEFDIPESGGTFQGVWRSARTFRIEGNFMLNIDNSQNDRIIGLRLRGVADGVEPFDWEIPIGEKVGNGYQGTDRSGRNYFLRLIEPFKGPEF